MSQRDYDTLILGGGHNGLTAAAYLAKAGLRVLVLERNERVGGAAVTEEFAPGFRNSLAAYAVSLLAPEVIADLDLARHGLTVIERPVANFWPIDERRCLIMPSGTEGRARAIGGVSERDGERVADYDRALETAAGLFREMALRAPPNAGGGLCELMRSAWLGRRLAGLGLAEQRLFGDLATKSVADFLGLWFQSDIVKGALAFDGIVGSYAPPSSPGTAYVLLHHAFGEVNGKPGVWGHAKGGMGAISEAIAAAGRAAGADIRMRAEVAEVIVEDRRAAGVRLTTGEVIKSRTVAAAVAPKLLFRDLVAKDALPAALSERFLKIRSGSGVFRMNVALSELPSFTCRPGSDFQAHHASGIVIGPTLQYLERAYQDATQDGWSSEPVIEMLIPSTLDPTLAPPGRHVASLFVQYVAPELPQGRSWDDAKETFADLVFQVIDRHAPNFSRSVIARQVLSPLDLERRLGLVDGDIFHGQLSLDQIFSQRPLLGYAGYRLPVRGLYLAGSGAHPGGGVTGLPGRNAARAIVRDLKLQKLGIRPRWPQ